MVVFPELGLSAYTCDDLFHQRALLDACEAALAAGAGRVANTAPRWRWSGCRCASTTCCSTARRSCTGGRLLGVVPKTYLPNYGEFYEARQFSPADHAPVDRRSTLLGQTVPFGADLLFEAQDLPLQRFHVEICEDLWVPIPPSSYAALGRRDGAGQPVGVEHHDRQVGVPARSWWPQQSARCLAAYLYSSAGLGESTTDLAWDGQALIYENGELLAESRALCRRLAPDQRRRRPGAPGARAHAPDQLRPVGGAPWRPGWRAFAHRAFDAATAAARRTLQRRIERFPYVPADRHAATSAAARSTTSRCRRWCSGCRPAASTRW